MGLKVFLPCNAMVLLAPYVNNIHIIPMYISNDFSAVSMQCGFFLKIFSINSICSVSVDSFLNISNDFHLQCHRGHKAGETFTVDAVQPFPDKTVQRCN